MSTPDPAQRIPDFGTEVWESGVRQHRRLILIAGFIGIQKHGPKNLVLGRVLLVPNAAVPDGVCNVACLTRQTQAQILQAVADETKECAMVGFLKADMMMASPEQSRESWLFRPLVGRIGLRGPERRLLEQRRHQSYAAVAMSKAE